MEIRKISIKKLGPIQQAEMEAGDLTVFVGPQATGKSLCLQSIKLYDGWVTISAGSWSAGQREFMPMLLGMYHLMPTGRGARRNKLRVAMVEELEMGLHPKGVAGAILMLMELIGRGYQVFVSTHSPTVLDFVWAVRHIKANHGTSRQFLRLFGIDRPSADSLTMAEKCLGKKFKVHYFEPTEYIRGGIARTGVVVKDISDLDPGSADASMSGWGGLTEFSSRAAEVVAALNHSSRRS